MSAKIDLTGQTYGQLTVLALDRREKEINFWLCRCECGVNKIVRGYNLRSGATQSCGCHRLEKLVARNKTGKHHTGDSNGRQRAAKIRLGKDWLPSADYWCKKAAGRKFAAKQAGITFGFSSTQAFANYCREITPLRCPVFGFEFMRGDTMRSPSIDRIEPHLGYAPGNIQIISNKANLMKNGASSDELKQFAKWVLK